MNQFFENITPIQKLKITKEIPKIIRKLCLQYFDVKFKLYHNYFTKKTFLACAFV